MSMNSTPPPVTPRFAPVTSQVRKVSSPTSVSETLAPPTNLATFTNTPSPVAAPVPRLIVTGDDDAE